MRDLGRSPSGTHQHHRLAGVQVGEEVRRAAHLERDHGDQPLFAIDPCAGQGQPFHREGRAFDAHCERLEVLHAVELPWIEATGGDRRAQHDFDDARREPLDLVYHRAQVTVQPGEEGLIRFLRRRLDPGKHCAHDRIALLGATHRLHHVAEVRGMQVAEEAHEAPIRAPVQQDLRRRGLGGMPLGLHRGAGLVASLEILAVESEGDAFLAGEHRVGLRAGSDQYAPRTQLHLFFMGEEENGLGVAVLVDFDADGGQSFREGDAFLERLLDLLVVQRIGGTVDQTSPVGDRHAAP